MTEDEAASFKPFDVTDKGELVAVTAIEEMVGTLIRGGGTVVKEEEPLDRDVIGEPTPLSPVVSILTRDGVSVVESAAAAKVMSDEFDWIIEGVGIDESECGVSEGSSLTGDGVVR